MQEISSAIAIGGNNYHRRSLTEVSANDGIALKMKYSEMADTSNMFVKENYKPPTAFNLKPFSIVYLCNIV